VAFLSRERGSSPVIAAALIVARLLGGLPLLSGVIITTSDSGPAFTLDICHPLPGLNHSSGFSPVPLVDGPPSLDQPFPCGIVYQPQTPPVIGASEAPDPPPPKPLS
jgi:hypothetical protein